MSQDIESRVAILESRVLRLLSQIESLEARIVASDHQTLTRQIAVQLCGLLTDGNAEDVWRLAEDMANADPWRRGTRGV
jgi:hypothetical protein